MKISSTASPRSDNLLPVEPIKNFGKTLQFPTDVMLRGLEKSLPLSPALSPFGFFEVEFRTAHRIKRCCN